MAVTITGAKAATHRGNACRVPKKTLVCSLVMALEGERLKVASGLRYAEALKKELGAFERKLSRHGNNLFEFLSPRRPIRTGGLFEGAVSFGNLLVTARPVLRTCYVIPRMQKSHVRRHARHAVAADPSRRPRSRLRASLPASG